MRASLAGQGSALPFVGVAFLPASFDAAKDREMAQDCHGQSEQVLAAFLYRLVWLPEGFSRGQLFGHGCKNINHIRQRASGVKIKVLQRPWRGCSNDLVQIRGPAADAEQALRLLQAQIEYWKSCGGTKPLYSRLKISTYCPDNRAVVKLKLLKTCIPFRR